MKERKQAIPFHPVIAEWFEAAFGEPTDVQREAWRAIGAKNHTLIAAPTGSGKTLAALLPCLDGLARGERPEKPGVSIVYVTPLKALNNDIHHHAIAFVEELEALAASRDVPWEGIRCAVRTGDTTPSARAAMIRRPPDLLVTTPESLYLLLTSEKGRGMLTSVRHVVVDEIHDLAADKRGAHLALSLERLGRLVGKQPQRIGVSATQKPLEKVARFLAGWERGTEEETEARPRAVAIIESAMSKRIDVRVTMPDQNRPATNREAVWLPLLDRIVHELEGCRAALLFVNSRRLCERLCLRLNDHVGYEMARSHHGSLSKELRLDVEKQLKEGKLRCIVATSSLELGIDIGHIDRVIQIDSPQEAARGIQRIGRAGHAVGEASQGVMIARSKAALPEMAVLARQISLRQIEEIRIPDSPMDVLSQHIVSMAAAEAWPVEALHRFVQGCDSYNGFPYARLEQMLLVLSGFYPFAKPLIDWDRRAKTVKGRSNTAMAAITGVGTIPQTGNYPVHHLESRAHLGELDEEYIQESRVGDVFQLGTSSWMIREIRNDRVYVSEAGNRFSEIPFWRNEAGSRSFEVGTATGAFLRELSEKLALDEEGGISANVDDDEDAKVTVREKELDEHATEWLASQYALDETSSAELIGFVRAQHRACAVPTDRTIVVEQYRDVMNQTRIIIHSVFGRTVNRAWLLAIERHFEQLRPYRPYGNAKDGGIEFVMPEWDSSWMNVVSQVTPESVELLLTEAISGSPLLGIAFRRIAENSLLLSRSFTRTPLWQKRLRSEELLRGALPYADDFPYLHEAMRECLRDELRVDDLKLLLGRIGSGELRLVFKETPYPSPLAAQFIADYANMKVYEGDGLDETTKLHLLSVSKEMASRLFDTDAYAAPSGQEALAHERARLSEPDRKPANAEELAALLKARGDMTSAEIAKLAGEGALGWLRELQEKGRAATVDPAGDGEYRWIAADETDVYSAFPDDKKSSAFVVGRYADRVLSFTEAELCDRYPAMTLAQARNTVDDLVGQGIIERAPHAADENERMWSSAKVASRIVRSTIRIARSKAEPIDPAAWCSRIAFMQHALSGAQQQGGEGLLSVIERLQGIYLPLSHWETVIFPSRVTAYKKDQLDLLCASGEIVWLGRKEEDGAEGKVAFFLAGSRALYLPLVSIDDAVRPTQHPELLELLRQGGASFLTRLCRETERQPSELVAELIELVWEGRVSNDQFAPLRLHDSTKHGQWARTGSGLGRWYATSLLGDGDKSVDADTFALIEPTSDWTAGDRRDSERSPVLGWARHLLQSFGIVNKELVSKLAPYPWETFYPVLKKLEEWGALTRGAYIQGMSAVQFTTRELAEAVRQPLPALSSSGLTVLCSVDPANPYGLLVDWPQPDNGAASSFSRKPGNFLVLRDGCWLFWIEGNGKKIHSLAGEMPLSEQAEVVQSTLQTILRRRNLVKVKVDAWNGVPISETEAGDRLKKLGGERDRQSLVFWLR
ncbi:DEAD/DEAH box helicase [Cohnella suwonensis]|uniref:DEAD/DEAH box helicase n=1 Tax=Cohnella suwonensis TaxID=696072 RepID=A0ABW0M5X6_9BACL